MQQRTNNSYEARAAQRPSVKQKRVARPTARTAAPHAASAGNAARAGASKAYASPSTRQHSASRTATPHYSQDQIRSLRATQHRRSKAPFAIAGIAALAVAAAVGMFAYSATAPINVQVNGQNVELAHNATVADAFAAAGSPATPGNLLDIDGEILQEGGGQAFAATLDGEPIGVDDVASTQVRGHASLEFSNGADVEEPSTTAENQALPHGASDTGTGTFHIMVQAGSDGVGTVRTGSISGKQQVLDVSQQPIDAVYSRCYADVGNEKVVALTFDDGPWDGTNEILDILQENGAKATFFVVGNRITGDGVEAVKREAAEGHQVATHTFDHAAGNGQSVNLSYMTRDEQRDEIAKGFQAIQDATGTAPSRVMRAPGGNFPTEVWENVDDLVDADIRWDIDTLDWEKPGASAIEGQLLCVTPGDVVLLHDGGGDRSQTIAALKSALPKLKKAGWKFVTIDELLQYPTK